MPMYTSGYGGGYGGSYGGGYGGGYGGSHYHKKRSVEGEPDSKDRSVRRWIVNFHKLKAGKSFFKYYIQSNFD